MQIMYIGPTVKGVIEKNNIYKYYPEKIIKKLELIEPLSKYLFVNLDNIVYAKNEIKNKGSFLNVAYSNLVIKKGGF